jgi:fibronectin type 3 domain-containing protein
MSGSVQISSNAANSPTVIPLSGTGVFLTAHSVALRWNASPSPSVVGYIVYRATLPSTTYAILSSPISGLNYTDETVEAGQTYTYVVTAVNPGGQESPHSQSVTAVIP